MLQMDFIKANRDYVIERLKVKNFKPESSPTLEGLIDTLIQWDDERKSLLKMLQETEALKNKQAREIGLLIKEGKKEEAEARKREMHFNQEDHINKGRIKTLESRIKGQLEALPNLPSAKVPPGRTPADNEVVRTGGSKPELYSGAVPHWDLAKKYELIDFELGNKITGSGFPVYRNKGAKLQRALIQYFLDYNTAAGYTEYQPPLMVNEASAYGTGQLPDKEGQMYHATEDQFYLIPTSEVPLTNIYRDEILRPADLPIRMTAYTPCFRREAGSYGKDVRGLNRLHQFDKVEIVQIVHPDTSYDVLEEMVEHVERLIQSLGLHYRILRLCGGDMGFASALTYDFEVYSAAQEKWLEVSSVSNFETFQTNRMKIRLKNEGKTQLLHSLNGSSLALPRILACLLENNQTENGILLPKPVQAYFGSEMI